MDVTNDFIIFKINDLLCGLNCVDVQEIIRKTKGISIIKRSPKYVEGVINIRGEIVSVLNLAVLYNFKEKENKKPPSIIVVNYEGGCFGLLVSEVLDIISEREGNIEHAPTTPPGMKKEHVKGTLEVNGQLITLLDKHELLCEEPV